MIEYIKGEISTKTPTYIVVEAAGIGYRINISLHTYARIEKLSTIKILTVFIVKEDSQTLFGFADSFERNMFVKLISVSGVGPSTAQVMLSSMSAEEIREAIISEQVSSITKIKGIGPKTAKRIILDLKDNLLKDSGAEGIEIVSNQSGQSNRDEAILALVGLGFAKNKVQIALNKVQKRLGNIESVEALIKAGLKELSQ